MKRIRIVALFSIMLFSCREKATLLYSVDHEEHVIHFSALPDWKSAWSEAVIDKLESGELPAYNFNNRPFPGDSVRFNRQLPPSIFGDDHEATLVYGPEMIAGILSNEGKDEYIDLMFFDEGADLFRFYARVRIADLETVIDKDIVFLPGRQEYNI